MNFLAFCCMVRRPTFTNMLDSFKEIDYKIWDKAGFRAYIYKWQEIPFLIFIIKEKNKDLVLEVMKKSNHAMVEGAPTIISKEKIKMDLIRIAKELSKQNEDKNLKRFFSSVYERLSENESTIINDLNNCQGSPVNTYGYYKPDDKITSSKMRPSKTFNEIIDSL